jgi:UDP-GlcNAc:undecaprenyl-phosphate GlcNAc-1-phosphate transferase
MRLGHGQRRAVFILWAWTALLAGFVLAPTYTNEGNALVPFGIAGLALVLYAIFHPTAREARRAAAEPAPEVVLLDPDVVLLEPADDLEEPQPPRAQHA